MKTSIGHVERLRREGHQVQYIVEMQTGISDEEVLDKANAARSILITADSATLYE